MAEESSGGVINVEIVVAIGNYRLYVEGHVFQVKIVKSLKYGYKLLFELFMIVLEGKSLSCY